MKTGGYVYVMKCDRLPFRCKIGITGNPYFRVKTVDETTKGKVEYVVCYRFWFPKRVEKRLHKCLRVFRSRKIKGSSGGTEWFWIPPFWGGFILFCVWVIGLGIRWMLIGVILIISIKYIKDGEIEGLWGDVVGIFGELWN